MLRPTKIMIKETIFLSAVCFENIKIKLATKVKRKIPIWVLLPNLKDDTALAKKKLTNKKISIGFDLLIEKISRAGMHMLAKSIAAVPVAFMVLPQIKGTSLLMVTKPS
jgi:hypothetical protein